MKNNNNNDNTNIMINGIITLLQYVVIHKKILLFAGINVPIVSRTENTKPFIDYFKKLMQT